MGKEYGMITLLFVAFGTFSQIAFASDDIKQCAQQKVAFDGIKPLKYADVTGEANSHIPLWHEHPALCTSADEAKCKGKVYLIPGNTVAVANTCGEYAHVQFIGEKTISYGWVLSTQLKQLNEKLPFDAGEPGGLPRDPDRAAPATIKIKLIKGHGVPVCEAYLQRLNQTVFHEIPSCSRPDNDQIPGFTRLNRVPLTAAQVNHLYVSAYNLSHPLFLGQDGYRLHDAPAGITEFIAYTDPDLERGLKTRALTDADKVSVWGFSPEVDIENNGHPNNLVIWRDFPPIWGGKLPFSECGVLINAHQGYWASDQVPFILVNDRVSINVDKTNEVFGESTSNKIATEKHLDGRFQTILPVGGSIEIFKYRNLYYFDTTGRIVPFENVYGFDPNIHVYLRDGGQSRQICELSNVDKEWDKL